MAYGGRWLGATRRAMLSHRPSGATTPEARHKPPSVGFSSLLASSSSSTDAQASLFEPLLASRGDRADPIRSSIETWYRALDFHSAPMRRPMTGRRSRLCSRNAVAFRHGLCGFSRSSLVIGLHEGDRLTLFDLRSERPEAGEAHAMIDRVARTLPATPRDTTASPRRRVSQALR